MLAQLRAKGADVAAEAQDMEGVGRFGWVTDPEGNRVELWQPALTVVFALPGTGTGAPDVGSSATTANGPQRKRRARRNLRPKIALQRADDPGIVIDDEQGRALVSAASYGLDPLAGLDVLVDVERVVRVVAVLDLGEPVVVAAVGRP